MLVTKVKDHEVAGAIPHALDARVEAAPGVERSEAPTIDHAERSLYAPRVKVYPKRAHGTFRTIKWIVMAVTLTFFISPGVRRIDTMIPSMP